MSKEKKNTQNEKRKLSRQERKQIDTLIRQAKGDGKPHTAQDSIPFERMYKDGICRLANGRYSKCIEFEDINYQLAQPDDKTAIFEALCDMYNSFDASISVQLSLISRHANKDDFKNSITIAPQNDDFDSIRAEYTEMLRTQLERGNNGLIKTKFLTFTVEAKDIRSARARLARIETDTLNHFKVIGAAARVLDGKQRLEVLHGIFHPDGERFNFAWEWLPASGLSVKDFIAPSSFRFGDGRMFQMGGKFGAVSFLQIVAPELSDRMLADFMDAENGIMVQMPEEWKGGIDLTAFGRNAAEQEKGAFTEYGYIVESGDEWERQFEGREVPEEYRIMSYPQQERGEQDKVFMDAAEAQQTETPTAEPQQPRPVVPIILSSEKPGDKVKEITARLEQGIQAIFDSDRYKEFLTAMSKFHDYSLNNTILIAMQGGNLVKGYSQWQKEFDRHVKSGEKGIKIFAPAPYKVKKLVDKIDPDTRKPILDSEGKTVKEEKEVTVPAFKVVTVFDISQTEGKEFPDLSVKPLLADVEQYEDFFAALEKASPVPIAFEQITNGANGYFSLTDKRIAIKEGVSELQAVKTAIHEIAHAKLHDVDLNAPLEEQNRVDRRSREVQAESVAYTVCQHFGLDTSDYSFGYVAGWSSGKEMTELKASLETIQATAKELITEIEGHFTELQQQRQTEQEQEAKTKETLLLNGKEDSYGIYQLARREETMDLRFEPFDRLQATGHTVDRANYELVYTAPLTKDMTLGGIWQKFNIDRPADFKGHSLSVSDIVVLHQNGENTAHYVDSIGFQQVPEFLQEQAQQTPVFDKLSPEQQQALSDTVKDTLQLLVDADKRIYGDVTGKTIEAIAAQGYSYKDGQLEKQQPEATPESLMTGETVRTPRGNFHITDMNREQIEAAGFGFHHASEDGKYLIMGNGTQAFAIAAEQPQRDNPLGRSSHGGASGSTADHLGLQMINRHKSPCPF